MANIENKLDFLLNHYIVVCLFLAFFILTFFNTGSVFIVGVLGFALCAIGIVNVPQKVDLRVLIPLIGFILISMASSYATFGSIVRGYASTQMLFPVIYLLMAYLEDKERIVLRRLCAVWIGIVALLCVGDFVLETMSGGSASRMGGIMGNPNAMGIFMVIGWFALAQEEEAEGCRAWLHCFKPLVLVALALTLSMGSFLSMAVGLIILFGCQVRKRSWRGAVFYICSLLAELSIGVAIGLLMQIAATRIDARWMCVLLVVYLLVFALYQPKFRRFLQAYKYIGVVITVLGGFAALAAVGMRPSSVATFAERLEMMQNGLGYIMMKPLLGLGPYQWRRYNMFDADKYFDTYHIHNVLLNIGVELGVIAMAMLIIVIVIFYKKKKSPMQNACFTSFVFHNLIDTSFFYMAVPIAVILTDGTPQDGGYCINKVVMRIIFAVFAAIFAYNVYVVLQTI